MTMMQPGGRSRCGRGGRDEPAMTDSARSCPLLPIIKFPTASMSTSLSIRPWFGASPLVSIIYN